MQGPTRILPELRPGTEYGPQSPLFQSKGVYFDNFYKEELSQHLKTTNPRPAISCVAIGTQF